MSIGFKDRWAARQAAALLRLKDYWMKIYPNGPPKRPQDRDHPAPPEPPTQEEMEW